MIASWLLLFILQFRQIDFAFGQGNTGDGEGGIEESARLKFVVIVISRVDWQSSVKF